MEERRNRRSYHCSAAYLSTVFSFLFLFLLLALPFISPHITSFGLPTRSPLTNPHVKEGLSGTFILSDLKQFSQVVPITLRTEQEGRQQQAAAAAAGEAAIEPEMDRVLRRWGDAERGAQREGWRIDYYAGYGY